ncbi:translation initiation factor IF-2 [Xenococcus sp. PCC 7305]|uniref:translation initiation factor IF-2 n=1 Tax=Xenococcus sp. PCC 7305 TaxID=102125 RepID=UPI0002ABC392|nr:translation initiation factor IF-2 [Xenococcus sp. PCC 7305]ELS00632.1 translation initiation factor IF-2 [Xenococcus sp. PCC 7305]
MNNGKIRIYELSKELNLDNKDIKDICEQLNIAVKSHSSTITDNQAERVRAIAEKYPSTTKKTNPDQGKKEKVIKGKRKQQILAIHHKGNSANPPSSNPTTESTSATRLASPPKFPNQSTSSLPTSSAPQQPVSPKVQLQAPPKVSDSKSSSPSGSEISSVDRTDAKTTVQEIQEPAKQQIIAPPARPQLVKPVSRAAQEPSQTIANRSSRNKPAARPLAKQVTEEERPNSSQQAASVKKKTKQPSNALKLQRPQRKVASEPEPTETSVAIPEELENTDGTNVGVEEETPISKVDKLKRPNPPRKIKAKVWEEEDEETLDKQNKANKAKGKRRPKPVIDDDDDDFGLSQEVSQDSAALSLSMARPPKPKSLQKQTATVAATKKPKKTPFKAEKVPKAEKKTRKTVAAPPEKITLTSNLTVRALGEMLEIPETDIIKNLFFRGIAVNITQTLDLDTARLVAEELGVEVEIPEEKSAATKETEMLDEADLDNLQLRPPVVTIMGHVDHGKTTLLDSIRQSKVALGEAGGITQHIGAYHVDVEHEGKQQQIVFLDTPGHEAFTAMRARGTRVTDIAILVVAADDGVQPQTREAISHAKAAGVPLIVAINKIDKPESNPDRIKQELTEHGLVPEDWGGDTTMVPVSALKGENLDELLEMIILVSEIEELSANPHRPAKGTVIEAHLDRTRGPVASLLVQNGTLRVGDTIVAGSILGKIRAMIDDRGDKVEAATPSFAVEILGLNGVPEAGDEFDVFPSDKEARALSEDRSEMQRDSRLQKAMSSRRVSLSTLSAQAQEGELKELNLILKADVQGSLEAILGSLQQLPQNEVQIRILLSSPGEVTETDVDLAAASGAVIIGFNTTLATGSRQAADNEGVDIRQYDIIYKLLDDIQGAMEGLLDPEEIEESLGQIEVRAVFPVGKGAVAGCYVLSGKVIRNCKMRVRRKDKVIYEGTLDSLKRMKEDAREVSSGYECGVGCAKFADWQEGDIIEAYQMTLKRRTLSAN